jgi:hypothetical protein
VFHSRLIRFTAVAGFLRYRYNDKTIVSQINIPLFEIADKDSDVLLSLVEAGQIQTITILPDGKCQKSVIFGYFIYLGIYYFTLLRGRKSMGDSIHISWLLYLDM